MLHDGLGVFVDAVARDVTRLSQSASAPDAASVALLAGSWQRLVEFLALGPAPDLRDCPHCGAAGMRAATRCGYCWNELLPPESAPVA